MILWTLTALWLGCVTEPMPEAPPPCGELDGAACLAQAEDALARSDDLGVGDGLVLLDDACDRLEHAPACRRAGRVRVSGRANGLTTLGAESPFGLGIEDYTAACRLGDGQACWDLGRLHLKGIGLPEDDAAIARWFDAGCGHGHAESCVDRGILHEQGTAGPVDLEAARALFTQACDLGDGRGCVKLGLLRRADDDEAAAREGVARLEEGCAKGFAAGCGLAAIAWEGGQDVPADRGRRIAMLEAGAALGDRRAVQHLLDLVDGGEVAPERLDAIGASLAGSCEAPGQGDACLASARFLQARGGALDEVGGRLSRACAEGSKEACGRLGVLVDTGAYPADGLPVRTLLHEWGCIDDFAPSCLAMGLAYESGEGVELVDLDAASRMFRDACAGGLEAGCEGWRRVKQAQGAVAPPGPAAPGPGPGASPEAPPAPSSP